MDNYTFTQKVLDDEQTLYNIAKSILIIDTDCEDAVQNAILNAYTKLSSLKNEEYFKTWLVRILINECYKLKKRNSKFVPYEEQITADIQTLDNSEVRELYQAIMELKPKIRVAVVLFYIEGYSVNEIKDILKIPAGTVKSRLAKGRKALKSTLSCFD